jgi:hypothetical protein
MFTYVKLKVDSSVHTTSTRGMGPTRQGGNHSRTNYSIIFEDLNRKNGNQNERIRGIVVKVSLFIPQYTSMSKD